MLEYIDSHAHYYSEEFDADRDELLKSIHEGGVKRIINIGCSAESSRQSVGLAEKYDFIYAAVGIHPEEANTVKPEDIDTIKQLCGHEKTVAVGEIGLDYHYEGYDREKQIALFELQLEMAKELDLPVIIHSRDAVEDTMNVLKKHRPKGVVHCYTGSAETAKEILKLGMYLGFTGVLTFKNARKAVETVRVAPMDRLLLETDCPYMAPEPFRGKRSDSSMIVKVIDKMAEIKGISPEEAAAAATENTYRLFNRLR